MPNIQPVDSNPYFDFSGAEVYSSGVNLVELAQQVGTPLYVYNFDAISATYQHISHIVPAQMSIYFAIKANPSLGVCAHIRSLGAGAEIASIGELEIARAAGFDPQDVIFNGPGKTDAALSAAIDWGVKAINVESLGDARRIATVAHEIGKRVSVFVRVNPEIYEAGALINTSTGPQKFGVELTEIDTVIATIKDSASLSLEGFHIHIGSQLLHYQTFTEAYRWLVQWLEAKAVAANLHIGAINFGGGLGIRYCSDDPLFDWQSWSQELREILSQSEPSHLGLYEGMLELGRSLTAEAGVYITQVLDCKWSKGEQFIVTDGGINHAMLPITVNQYPVRILNRLYEHDGTTAFVGGPLCTSADLSGTRIPLNQARPGDYIGFFNAGAYGYSVSLLNFLSFPTPAEYAIVSGQVLELRPHGHPSHVLRDQELPA